MAEARGDQGIILRVKGDARRSREGKVRKRLWLDPKLLRRAQEILGTATDRETVETALDLIVFHQELLAGTRVLSELKIDPIRC